MTTRSGERNSAGLVARSTRHRFHLRSGVALLALVLHGGACAVATYPGPRRPSSEVALVEARDLAIDEIDGLDVRGKGCEVRGSRRRPHDGRASREGDEVRPRTSGRIRIGPGRSRDTLRADPLVCVGQTKALLHAGAEGCRRPLAAGRLRRLPRRSGSFLRAGRRLACARSRAGCRTPPHPADRHRIWLR